MEELPLLHFTSDLFPEVDLENITIIAIQHVIDITHLMFLELYKKGLRPENTYLLGKCYSSNKGTSDDIRNKGAYVSDLSFTFDSHIAFDEQYPSYVRDFIEEIKKQRELKGDTNKIILVDDGGFLIKEILNDKDLLPSILSATELTSSGYSTLKDLETPFPIINIARSKAKLEVEGKMIANLAVHHIENIFKEESLNGKDILIIGGGAIGSKVHNIFISKRYNSYIYDANKDLSTTFNFKETLKNVDAVIGATGSSPITLQDIENLKKKLWLISLSSSDREFPSSIIRNCLVKNSDPHQTYYYKNIVLVNSGFPINFTGERISLPLEQVQLTGSLILSAIFQASKERGSGGFVVLEENIQDRIVSEFLKICPQYKESW